MLCRLDASSQMGCDGWVAAGMGCGSRVAGNDGQVAPEMVWCGTG